MNERSSFFSVFLSFVYATIAEWSGGGGRWCPEDAKKTNERENKTDNNTNIVGIRKELNKRSMNSVVFF